MCVNPWPTWNMRGVWEPRAYWVTDGFLCMKWSSSVHKSEIPHTLKFLYTPLILSREFMHICYEHTSTSIASGDACRHSISLGWSIWRHWTAMHVQPSNSCTTPRHIYSQPKPISVIFPEAFNSLLQSSPRIPYAVSPPPSPSLFLPSSVSSAAFPIWNLNRRIARISQDSSTPASSSPQRPEYLE